jgi:hypothetical protein
VNDEEDIDIPNDSCADQVSVTVDDAGADARTPWALNVTLDGVESPVSYGEKAKVVADITHVGNVSMTGISKLTISGGPRGRSDVGVDVSGLNLGPAETVRKTFTWNTSEGFAPPDGSEGDYQACVEAWRDGTADPPDDVACGTITVENDSLIIDETTTLLDTDPTENVEYTTVATNLGNYDNLRCSLAFDDAGVERFNDDGEGGETRTLRLKAVPEGGDMATEGTVVWTKSWCDGAPRETDEDGNTVLSCTVSFSKSGLDIDISGNSGNLVLVADDGESTISPP